MSNSKKFTRFAVEQLREALSDTPVVLIHGARQCGKSTLARMAGNEYEYITFDDFRVLEAAQRDPINFVNGLPERVILDEVQRIPELFVTIKLSVDRNRKPGRFILTGSSNVLLLPRLSDSLAGRIEIIHLFPLAQCEIENTTPEFFQRAFEGDFTAVHGSQLGEDLPQRVAGGGYPEPLLRDTAQRRKRWYTDYIKTLIERDISELSQISKADVIPKLLTMLANNSAQLVNINALSNAFKLTRPTIEHYVNLLRQIFLVEFLPSWYTNRNSRLVKTPKSHLTDSGLICALLNLDAVSLAVDHNLYGHVLESFIYMELRKLASRSRNPPEFFHYRDKDNYEVDIVLEWPSRVVGIEVKAGATVWDSDFKGLRRLKRQLGKKMKAGIVLYDGERALSFRDGMYVVPYHMLFANQ